MKTTIDRMPSTRAFRPHQLRTAHNAPCCEPADAGARQGLSQLERGRVTLIDERMCRALAASIEDTLRTVVADRFALRAAVTRAISHDTTGEFVVVLSVQPRS
jgi:hypothetical protein